MPGFPVAAVEQGKQVVVSADIPFAVFSAIGKVFVEVTSVTSLHPRQQQVSLEQIKEPIHGP